MTIAARISKYLALAVIACLFAPHDAAAQQPIAGLDHIDGFDREDGRAQVIILGEWHGTAEAPQFVGDLAMTYARQGERVAVVLEQPDVLNAAFVEAGASLPGRRAYCEALQREFQWSRGGHSSAAIAELTAELSRAAWVGGLPIAVFGMDLSDPIPEHIGMPPTTYRRDHHAANIARYAQDADVTIVLVGNAHPPSLKRRLVEQYAIPTVTLGMVWAEGEAWNCQQGRCGVHHTEGNLGLLAALPDSAPAITPAPVMGHDLGAYLGPITASPLALSSGWCERTYATTSTSH